MAIACGAFVLPGAPARAAALQDHLAELPLDADALKDLARSSPDELRDPRGSGRTDVGRPFRLTLPFTDGRLGTRITPATWSYDASAAALTLSFRPVGAAETSGVELEEISRSGRRLNVAPEGSPPQLGQAVRARKLDADFIQTPPTGSRDPSTFAVKLDHVTREEAQTIIRSGRVELAGRVAAFAHAGPSRCSVQAIRKPSPEPTLTNLVTCAVALRLESVAFTVPGRGTVKVWTAAPPVVMAVAPRVPPSPPATPADTRPRPSAAAGAEGALARSGPPQPAPPFRRDHELPPPTWISSPGPELVERFYPLSAYADATGGSVTLDCLELESGRVTDCIVSEETPLGAGFGRAALSLSRAFLFTPLVLDGRAIRGRIRIPYTFSVSDGDSASTPASAETAPQAAAAPAERGGPARAPAKYRR